MQTAITKRVEIIIKNLDRLVEVDSVALVE
jgi:hypothetical protein